LIVSSQKIAAGHDALLPHQIFQARPNSLAAAIVLCCCHHQHQCLRPCSPSRTCCAPATGLQGITRAFALNALHHASRLLADARAAADDCAGVAADTSPATLAPPLDPGAFDYHQWCNEAEGRHEGYFLAMKDTWVGLPTHTYSTADPRPPHDPKATACTSPAAARDSCPSTGAQQVFIKAGDLIQFELSHKYSEAEVQGLASAAGFARAGSWADERALYDLHLFAPQFEQPSPSAPAGGAAGAAGAEFSASPASKGRRPPAVGWAGRHGLGGAGGSEAPSWRDWVGLWRLWDAVTLEVSALRRDGGPV
jgi:hypothetical protein